MRKRKYFYNNAVSGTSLTTDREYLRSSLPLISVRHLSAFLEYVIEETVNDLALFIYDTYLNVFFL